MSTKHGVWFLHDHAAKYVAEQALSYGYSHIWVMPGAGLNLDDTANGDGWNFQISKRHEKPTTLSAWKRGTGHVNIILLENTAWVEGTSAFKTIGPGLLMDTIHLLEEKVGVTITGSPASSGWALLKKFHPEWIEAIPVDWKELHFVPASGPDIIWQRPYVRTNARMHLVKVDKRSAYPAASLSNDYGKGTPVHVEGQDAVRTATHEKGNPQSVGVWNCLVTAMAINEDMPPKRIPSGQYWLSGPRIRMLEAAGYSVEPLEGYVFSEQHDLLAKWANFLWTSRQELTGPAADACKQIANTTIGFTAFKGFEDEDEQRRPDIRLQTVSRNAEIMWFNIDKVRKLYKATPLMVYMDACYYLSAEPDGGAISDEMCNRMGNASGLGRFRYEGSIEVTPNVQAILTKQTSVAAKLVDLNKIGWAK